MIELQSSKLESLSFDDAVLNEVSQTGAGVLSGGVNSMSERKRLTATFEHTPDEYGATGMTLPGANLFVNFSLFLQNGSVWTEPAGPPNSGFNVILPTLPSSTVMTWYSNANSFPESCRNWSCSVILNSSTNFTLIFTYYNSFDEYSYLSNSTKNNEWRWLSEKVSQLNFNQYADSFYHSSKDIRVMTYLSKTGLTSEKYEVLLYTGQGNTYDTAMTLEDSDNNPLLALSTIHDTEVVAFFGGSMTNVVEYFYAKIIKLANDPNLDFQDNYDYDENWIDASNTGDNTFIGPFTVTFDTDHYELTFKIDHSLLVQGSKYRIIVLAYDEGTGSPSYTGAVNYLAISAVLPTTNVVAYCDTDCSPGPQVTLDFAGSISDINQTFSGNELTVAIEERLRSQLIIDYSSDKWKDNLECRFPPGSLDEFSATNDIRKYLSAVTWEIYTEYEDANLGGTIRNVLGSSIMQRSSISVALGAYVTNGIVFDFDTVAEQLTMYMDFRCRDEVNTPCDSTTLDGSPFFPVQDNQYWGGKDIFIDWTVFFYYNDFPTPFIDKLVFTQKLHVENYSESVMITQQADKVFVCPGETVCYDASILYASPEEYFLINTLEPVDSSGNGNGLITEGEEFVPAVLAQQTTPVFFDQDEKYVGGDAQFCFNPATLIPGQEYKLTAMAKKS